MRIVFQVALQVDFFQHLGDVASSSSGFSLSQFVLFSHVIPFMSLAVEDTSVLIILATTVDCE